ncbi:CHAT domain-containing protein [Tardiphaga sp. 20_F10_N6_6]|uniref:CHAT domain-containing protein n=1 Tax=Tardiphaga sp. 20_F10_N6_6 TaxID=3240788 RepID=UPI003F8B728B
MFEALIEELHSLEKYPVLIVERFHSFAKVPDDAFLSILSSMRSFEHGGMLTTVALSPLGYDSIRREIATSLPFVNSSYGDNHDRAVMSPLTANEFRVAGERLELEPDAVGHLYSLGGGPDIVYQALLDEAQGGIDGIVSRCVVRLGDSLTSFLNYAIGPLDYNRPLLRRLIDGAATQTDAEFFHAILQSGFLVSKSQIEVKCAGPVLSAYIRALLEREEHGAEVRPRQLDARVKILLVSANSLSNPLDIEAEVRDLLRQLGRTLHRDKVEINHCQAATPDEVVFALRTFMPDIVHFSGHGDEQGVELRAEGSGGTHVAGIAIARAFQDRGVRLAVFNVCHSNHYAAAIALYVEAVVATSDEVDDDAAKYFAVAFYRTIASGFTAGQAFRDGTSAVEMNGFSNVFRYHGNAELRFVGG